MYRLFAHLLFSSTGFLLNIIVRAMLAEVLEVKAVDDLISEVFG